MWNADCTLPTAIRKHGPRSPKQAQMTARSLAGTYVVSCCRLINMNAATQDIPFRVRIGVTGHRDLRERNQDIGVLEALVKEAVYTRLEEIFTADTGKWFREARENNSPPVRYCVVSPLAEGSDRLVARTILLDEQSRLDAVLPLVKEDYVRDFANAESKLESDSLSERCRK